MLLLCEPFFAKAPDFPLQPRAFSSNQDSYHRPGKTLGASGTKTYLPVNQKLKYKAHKKAFEMNSSKAAFGFAIAGAAYAYVVWKVTCLPPPSPLFATP
jgi:hypothetical protein